MSTPRACVELSQRAMDSIERIKKEFGLRYDSEAVVLAIKETETITPGLPEMERVKTMTYRQPEEIEQKVSMLAEKYNISKRHVVESALYALSLTYAVNHRCKFAPGQEVWVLINKKPVQRTIDESQICLLKNNEVLDHYFFDDSTPLRYPPESLFSTREECEAHYGIK